MDWFERLTGFRELDYTTTRQNLEVDGTQLRSRVNGASFGIGEFELVSLQVLRERVQRGGGMAGKLRVRAVSGDVRKMHRVPEYAGALFQVASQFNMLEMVSENVTPEHGVTRYENDGTQGPGCAIAAGAATIYRNYFVPVGDNTGQTSDRQLDGLASLGGALSAALGQPVSALWEMRNGYALCSQDGLDAIAGHLARLNTGQTDALRARLHIGVHSDVEVTDADGEHRPRVSQAFCSALPVAYTGVPPSHWEAFATLVLEAAYEATMWAAVLNARRGGSNLVLLTRLGGGVFGNDVGWIHAAMRRALKLVAEFDLDVRLVSHGGLAPALVQMAGEFD
jgi:hypothetical protein